MTNGMHSSYNKFLFHSFLSALHVSNESSHSSSGALRNILYQAVWYNRYNRASRWSLIHCNMMHGTHINTLQYDARYTQLQIYYVNWDTDTNLLVY